MKSAFIIFVKEKEKLATESYTNEKLVTESIKCLFRGRTISFIPDSNKNQEFPARARCNVGYVQRLSNFAIVVNLN